jgi:hypothetical protein
VNDAMANCINCLFSHLRENLIQRNSERTRLIRNPLYVAFGAQMRGISIDARVEEMELQR